MGRRQFVKFPKPKPVNRIRQRRTAEAKVIKAVRAKVAERDGYCRLGPYWNVWIGSCRGKSEWCHMGEWKRFKTMRMAPEKRHQTKGSFMACELHHDMYDDGRISITYGPDGADGPLVIVRAA